MKVESIRENGSVASRIYFDRPGDEGSVNRVKPEFAKQANINNIIKRYKKTGILGDPLKTSAGMYGDFTNKGDYYEVMRKIVHVKDTFSRLPAEFRAKLGHDPANLIDWLQDEKNYEEALKLGLVEKRAVKPANEPAVKPVAAPEGNPAPVVDKPVTPAPVQ